MKKLYLLLFLLFSIGFTYGQCPVSDTIDITSTSNCDVDDLLPVPALYDTIWYSYSGVTNGSGVFTSVVGPPNVTWELGVTDVRLLIDTSVAGGDTCEYSRTAVDQAAPDAGTICGDVFTVYLDDNGDVMVDTVSAVQAAVLAEVEDACQSDVDLTVGFGDKEFVCADTTPVGLTHTVSMTVEDSLGNYFQCDVHFEVKDSTSPEVLCDVDTVYLDSMGLVSITTANLNDGSSDNCGIDSMWLSAYDFGCDFVGDTTVTLYARDGSGNSGSCSNTVTVIDTIAPMIYCLDDTVYLDRNGEVEVMLADVLDSVWENTCIANIDTFLSDTMFYCAALNYDSLITVTVYDHDSLVGTCNSLITVLDTISPEAICVDDTVYLDSFSSAYVTWMNVLDSAWDNCSLIDTTLSWDTQLGDTIKFDCSDADSIRVVTVEVEDHVTLTGSCDADVTILDTISPSVICEKDTVYLDAGGDAHITWWTHFMVSDWDNCSIIDHELSGNSQSADSILFDCSDVGNHDITITVEDQSGNTGTCTETVTVIDAIAPTVACLDIDVYLDNSTGAGSVTITDADLVDSTVENCTIDDTTATQYTFTCSDLGTVQDTVTVTDHVGLTGTCVSTVTVIDTFPPTMVCDNDLILFLDTAGIVTLDSAVLDMGSYDNCAIVEFELSRDTFDCTFVNKTDATVTMTATDTYGLTSECTADVSVNDTTNPTAECKDIDVWLDSTGSATIIPADVDNGSTDNSIACGIDTTIDVSTFGCGDLEVLVGTIPVTLTVTDIADSTDQCVAQVTVIDTIKPTADCVYKDTVYLDATGNVSVISSQFVESTWDNCSGDTVTIVESGFTCDNVGDTIVIVTVIDNGGLTGTCDATVTVMDTVPPVAICQKDTIYLNGSGYAWLDDDDINNGSNDACGIDTTYLDNDDFYCADMGNNDVTLTVIDVNGNPNTCATTVTVLDMMDPTVTCKDTTVYLDGSAPGLNGQATIDAAGVILTDDDNCGITYRGVSKDLFTCADIGSNTVTVTVKDASLNSATCDATVWVKDYMDPVIVCNELKVELWGNESSERGGEYVLDEAEKAALINGSWDNCTELLFEDFSFDNFSFECVNDEDATNYVPAKVRVIVADDHNNIDTAYCPVTVEDVTPPVAKCRDTSVVLDADGHGLIFPGWVNDANDRESVPELARTYNELEGGSWDWCGIAVMELSQVAFDCSDIGDVPVTLTVIDPSGYEDECISIVTVIDDIPPVVDPIADVDTMIAPGVCETMIDYPAIVASDICGVTIDSSGALGPDAMFPIGTTTETYVVTDGGGNSVSVSFDVTVTTYNGAPTINDIVDVDIDEDNSKTILLSGITVGADANCDSTQQEIASVTVSVDNTSLLTAAVNAAGTEISLGTVLNQTGTAVVTVVVKDNGGTANGGIDSIVETFTVTVNEVNDPPFVVAPGLVDVDIFAAHTQVIPLDATLGVLFDDVDEGDELTITTSALPGWITFENDALTASPLLVDSGCVTITVTATDMGGLAATDDIIICGQGYKTGFKELTNNIAVDMFPNPTRDRVTLEVNGNASERIGVSVTNITGKEIFRKQFISTNIIELDMSSHVSGMYFVKLNVDGNEVVKKLILNR